MFKKVNSLIELATELSLATEIKKEVLAISLGTSGTYEIGGTYNSSMSSDKPVVNIHCFCEPVGEFYIIPRNALSVFIPHSLKTSYSKKESYERDLLSDLRNIKSVLSTVDETDQEWAVVILETNKQRIEKQLEKLNS